MNKNQLQRCQLLFYFGLGILGISAAKTAFSYSNEVNNSLPDTANPNNTGTNVAVASLPTNGTNLPPFQGISQWLNSAPLSIADLKGNVILVQFWTFACINCQRTLPYITQWHRQYASAGLKVIGIHTAEFAFERDTSNLTTPRQYRHEDSVLNVESRDTNTFGNIPNSPPDWGSQIPLTKFS